MLPYLCPSMDVFQSHVCYVGVNDYLVLLLAMSRKGMYYTNYE